MADNVEERLVSKFEAVGAANYQRTLGSIGEAAQRTGGMVSGLMRRVTPLNTALAAIGGALTLRGIATVGQQFENIQAKMAGTLQAMEIAPSFQEGLTQANLVINSINTAAAALPGEAEDYVRVFTETLPNVAKAVGGSMADLTAFTNQFTAVTSSMQITSGEAAMSLTQLLTPGIGMMHQMNQTHRTLLNQMKLVDGQAGLTMEKFNKMDAHARSNLIGKAMSKYGDMLTHQSTRWDAVIGAVKTTQKLVTRLATAGLFETMTKAMARMNSAFVDSNGQLTKFGKAAVAAGTFVSNVLAKAIDKMADRFVRWSEDFEGFLTRLQSSPVVKMLDSMFNKVAGLGKMAMAVAAPSEGGGGAVTAAAATTLAVMLGGPMVALGALAIGMDNVARIASALAPLFDALMTTGVSVVVALIPVISAAAMVATILIELLAPALTFVAEVMSTVVSNAGSVAAIFAALLPLITVYLFQQGLLDQVIITAALSMQGFIAGLTAANIEMVALTLGLALVVGGLIWLADFLKSWRGGAPDVERATFRGTHAPKPGEPAGPMGKMIAQMQAQMKEQQDKTAKSLKDIEVSKKLVDGGKAPGHRGGSKVVQDFRNSRFSIQQEFAEGFDPDRIAVAFSKDLGKLGEQRLQSGQEPLFGGGR